MLLLLAERSLVISGVDGCTTKLFLEPGSIEPDRNGGLVRYGRLGCVVSACGPVWGWDTGSVPVEHHGASYPMMWWTLIV